VLLAFLDFVEFLIESFFGSIWHCVTGDQMAWELMLLVLFQGYGFWVQTSDALSGFHLLTIYNIGYRFVATIEVIVTVAILAQGTTSRLATRSPYLCFPFFHNSIIRDSLMQCLPKIIRNALQQSIPNNFGPSFCQKYTTRNSIPRRTKHGEESIFGAAHR